ncbi:MAG TPA: hypothetical protein VGQ81_13755 [Acidobacteriota bacterium]|jgi:hypothetical protein|nr:hypothetical protein [Acidobacteriota bacterium]
MKLGTVLTCAILLALATVAFAQDKVSGTLQCAKADPQYSITVGDRPNHSFMIGQNECTWTKPMEIAGTQSKEHVSTASYDITGDKSTERGYALISMASGDKTRASWQGSSTMKEGQLQSGEGKWSFSTGTGKLRGIKGKGTYKCQGTAGGAFTCDVEGEYQVPKK